jgi:DNA mismatch repair protein MutL
LTLRPEDEISRVRSILSDGDDYPIITAEHEQDGFRDLGLKIRLHWIQGLSASNSRKLVQVVNARAVKDRILQQAVLAPFRQALLPGKFPAAALFIEINPAAIDVNVHPSKIEIRFLDNRKIFSSIDTLVKSMISRHGAPSIAAPSFRSNPSFSADGIAGSSADSSEGGITGKALYAAPAFNRPQPPVQETTTPQSNSNFPASYRSDEIFPLQDRQSRPFNPAEIGSLWKASEPETYKENPPFVRLNPLSDPLEFSRYAGTLFNTYLVYEKKNEVILIDQHAAHERIRYENLQKGFLRSTSSPNSTSMQSHFHSQALLIPEAIRVSTENRPLLSERLKQISSFGFEAELNPDLSKGSPSEPIVLFRAVPAEWGFNQLKPRLRNLIDRVISLDDSDSTHSSSGEVDGSIVLDEILFELLASEACHSSVRAGDPLELAESSGLVEQLFKCEHPWNCPHGRPTVVQIPQGKFEEWFQRRV